MRETEAKGRIDEMRRQRSCSYKCCDSPTRLARNDVVINACEPFGEDLDALFARSPGTDARRQEGLEAERARQIRLVAGGCYCCRCVGPGSKGDLKFKAFVQAVPVWEMTKVPRKRDAELERVVEVVAILRQVVDPSDESSVRVKVL